MAKVAKIYTVPGRGIGRPDYYSATAPGRTIIAPHQERWGVSLEADIPGGYDTDILDLYTVPANKQLNVTFWKASADKSGLLFGYFYNTGTFYGRVTADVFETGNTGESGAYVWTEEEIVQYRIVNPLEEVVSIAFRFSGTLTSNS